MAIHYDALPIGDVNLLTGYGDLLGPNDHSGNRCDPARDQRGEISPFESPAVDPAKLSIQNVEGDDQAYGRPNAAPEPDDLRVGDIPVFNVRQNRAPT